MSYYTTVTRVRNASWFSWNLDISDIFIEWYLIQAHAEVLSTISASYDVSELTWSLFSWSQAESFLGRIEELLASWELLIDEYWIEWVNTDKDWYKKCEEARKLLMKIVENDIKLLDNNYEAFPQTEIANAWAIAYVTATWTEYPYFTVNQKF